MSTELLTRRMDLIHSKVDNLNILKMDTSYPVKLSGIVIKMFKATSAYTIFDYKTEEEIPDEEIIFTVVNEDSSDVVTEIAKQNVLDFKNLSLKNNCWEIGDYVMAVIDIDNNWMRILVINDFDFDLTLKDVDYHCNGVNDNTVLGGIINTFIDIYDDSSDQVKDDASIDYDIDEFNYKAESELRKNAFRNSKININIIGKFGIDFGATDFVYGGFNRSNRSTIMKISGLKNYDDIIDPFNNHDIELSLNWEKCYIPPIEYNNETFAAMYNTKLATRDINGNAVYYDYFTKENTAHFVDENGNPYGNLYPRRLMFMSIEGKLPVNITIKNLSLNTFGVGIYCETESKKCLKIIDSKITIFYTIYTLSSIDMPLYNEDITNSQFHRYFSPLLIEGSAVDINAYNPKVEIINCKFQLGNRNMGDSLLINSSKNMTIIGSTINGDISRKQGYKSRYARYLYLDAEYNDDYDFTTETVPFVNPETDPERFPTYPTNRLAAEQYQNPNVVDYCIFQTMFTNALANSVIPVTPNFKICKFEPKFNSPHDVPSDPYTDFTDLQDRGLLTISTTESMTITSFTLQSKTKQTLKCFSLGIIKNIPILYRNNYSHYKLNIDLQSDITYLDLKPNNEILFTPNLYISSSKIESDGILYNYNAHTKFSDCHIDSFMLDDYYQPHQITIASGVVELDNTTCRFDTRLKYCYSRVYNWLNPEPLSFIYMYQNNEIKDKWINVETDPSACIRDNQYSVNSDSEPYGPAVRSIGSPCLRMNNSSILLIPDISFNYPNYQCNYGSSNNGSFTNIYSPRFNGDPVLTTSIGIVRTVSFIYSSTTDERENDRYFNPYTAPNININNCDFNIINTFSTSEKADMGIHNSEYFEASTMANLCRIGRNKIEEINNLYDTDRGFLKYNLIDSDDALIKAEDSDAAYINIVKVDYIMKDKLNNFSDNIIDKLVLYVNLEQSKLYRYTYYNDETEPLLEITDLEFEETDTVWRKLVKSGLFDYYDSVRKLYDCYGNGQSRTVNSDGDVLDENGNVIFDNDIEDYIFLTDVYGGEIENTALYIYRTFPDLLSSNQGIQTRDSKITNVVNGIIDIYAKFGVIAFKLSNCVFNMTNSNVGGNNTGSEMRHTYTSELLIRRSPRIAFDFRNNGNYKISNTKASAWGSVLWSTLHRHIAEIEQDKNYININSTTLALSEGYCIVDNCDFTNYNGIRHQYHSDDIRNLKNAINNEELVDSRFTEENNKLQTLPENVGGDSPNDYYKEIYINGNEMPIIFVYNCEGYKTEINNSHILGNEMVIGSGSVKLTGCTYINNSNAMLAYINDSSFPGKGYGFDTNPSRHLISNMFLNYRASLQLTNNSIVLTKDVVADKYIDRDRRKDKHTNCVFYEDCTKKGHKKYDNDIIAIYSVNGSPIIMDGNDIMFRCNSYHKNRGILDAVRVRLVLLNKFSDRTGNSKFINNTIRTAFSGPIIAKYDDVDRTIISRVQPLENDLAKRILPDSYNLSIIEFRDAKNSREGTISYLTDFTSSRFMGINSTTPVTISGNTILTTTIINNRSTYFVLTGDKKTSSDFNPNIILFENSVIQDDKICNIDSDYIVSEGWLMDDELYLVDQSNSDHSYSEKTISKYPYNKNTTDTIIIGYIDINGKINIYDIYESIYSSLNGKTFSELPVQNSSEEVLAIPKNYGFICDASKVTISDTETSRWTPITLYRGDILYVVNDEGISYLEDDKYTIKIPCVYNSETKKYDVTNSNRFEKIQLSMSGETVNAYSTTSQNYSYIDKMVDSDSSLKSKIEFNSFTAVSGLSGGLSLADNGVITNFCTPVVYTSNTARIPLNITNNTFLNGDVHTLSYISDIGLDTESVNTPGNCSYIMTPEGKLLFLTSSCVLDMVDMLPDSYSFEFYKSLYTGYTHPETIINVSNNTFLKNVSKRLIIPAMIHNSLSNVNISYCDAEPDCEYTTIDIKDASTDYGTSNMFNITEVYGGSEKIKTYNKMYTIENIGAIDQPNNALSFNFSFAIKVRVVNNYNSERLNTNNDSMVHLIEPINANYRDSGYLNIYEGIENVGISGQLSQLREYKKFGIYNRDNSYSQFNTGIILRDVGKIKILTNNNNFLTNCQTDSMNLCNIVERGENSSTMNTKLRETEDFYKSVLRGVCY